MIRVGILDNHPVVLWGMETALHGYSGIDVVATGCSAGSFDLARVDVLLLDMHLGGAGSPAHLVTKCSPQVRVILLSATRDADEIEEGFGAGASAFLHKSASREEIVATVRAVASGQVIRAATAPAKSWLGLSDRERQVVCMIGAGLTHAQIARRLGVSKHTVDTYVKRVRSKLNVGNKAELAQLATRLAHAAIAA